MLRQQNDDNNRYHVPAMPPAVSPIMEPKMPSPTPMMPPGISPITQPNMPPVVSPITQPNMPPAVSPIMQPNMPPAVSPIMQPGKPMMPPCPFSPPGTTFPPPGTAFNPIGVPPWAAQPGMPTTGMPSTQPSTGFAPRTGPPVLTNDAYLQAHLKQYIGRPIRAEFILGTNMFIDREGVLLDVGIDHIVMRETRTDDLLFADIYSIKFVTILL